jgi:tetratricopeptide (TPR) repeat protein
MKSPHNGRGLMNYGLTLMAQGNSLEALNYFERALEFTPNYYILEINLGIVNGDLQRDAEAERHFNRAAMLAPNDEQPPFYYARWLMTKGRVAEAIPLFQKSIAANRDYLDPRYALMQAYTNIGRRDLAKGLAAETLQIAPGDALAMQYYREQGAATPLPDPVANAEAAVKAAPTADNYVNLSLAYHQAKRFRDCIHAAQEALKLRPNYPEAYNNIAAANEDLHDWDAAIAAAREAVRLRPDFQLAKNNLAYSEAQKKLESK